MSRSAAGLGQNQPLAAGGFLASHLAMVAAMKRVRRLHARERKLRDFVFAGCLLVRKGKGAPRLKCSR
jgi:hypothetical protein